MTTMASNAAKRSTAAMTSEQDLVIAHPFGHHARVLAVAGSGKTTTLVHRIKHLTLDLGVDHQRIRVLMFNRFARQQFQDRMVAIGIPAHNQPTIHTFHSFAFHFIKEMMALGKLPGNLEFWLDEKEELIRLSVHRAITNLERSSQIEPEKIDPDEALQAIQLWKGSLIPPDRAGYRGTSGAPLVYAEFEKLRIEQRALTYDDFVPLTVSVLESEATIRNRYAAQTEHLIVDEYQDVNFGQQKLIELLAGRKADIMVVGDDDQTIHEWRGARPNYLIREYKSVFDNKPHVDYTLSRSFRFGPVIAQCAHNVICFNTTRVAKSLVANDMALEANLFVLESPAESQSGSNVELTRQVVSLVKDKQIPPKNIIVLCRMYAQLSGLQAEFLAHGVPFRVIGQRPFFERHEIRILLDYVRLALVIDQPVGGQEAHWLIGIFNKPTRYVRRADIERATNAARLRGWSTTQTLRAMLDDPNSPLNRSQRDRVTELLATLRETGRRITTEPELSAANLLRWLIQRIDYKAHFDEYYGRGEDAYDRQKTIDDFVGFAESLKLTAVPLLDYVDGLDTTLGVPEDQQIVMTTVFRAKGLEYDYVFIPDCTEGFMPCLNDTGIRTFDTHGIVEEPEPSEAIENERRLYYVAITRAKCEVYIGTAGAQSANDSLWSSAVLPSRFLDETQIEPAVQVMSALQRQVSGHAQGRSDIVTSVGRFASQRRLMESLLTQYLSRLGDIDLLTMLSGVMARAKEQPFAYRHAYTRGRAEEKGDRAAPNLHDAWSKTRY